MTRRYLMHRGKTFVIVIGLLQISHPASAGNCLSRADNFGLISDTVRWTFVIHAGSECLQGLRGGSMLLDEVKVVEPPSEGSLMLSGPAFIYRAPARESSDHFKLRISGEKYRIRG